MMEFLVVFVLVFVLLSGAAVFLWLLMLQGRIKTLQDSIQSLRDEIAKLNPQQQIPVPPPLPKPIPSEKPVAEPVHPKPEDSESAPLFDLEEKLGANWLLKLGMTMVVIGIALFLGYTFQRLGPAGKILIGGVVSAVCIVGGTLIERQKSYVVFGRVILSGGWALAYFTAYAMRHVEATRILQSDTAGLIAMASVSVAMILHSLRYSSEFFTGFAFGLAYLALMVSRVHWTGLVASTILAASAAVLVRFRKWYSLELFAIAATYLHHFVWIYPILETWASTKSEFPEFRISLLFLILYWLIFTLSHFLPRTHPTPEAPRVQSGIIVNAIGFTALSVYQSPDRSWSFHFFLILGAVYFGVALYARMAGGKNDFISASTIAAILLFVALPYKFSGQTLTILWLVEIEIFMIAGLVLTEKHFRRIAYLTSGPFLLHHISEQFRLRQSSFLTDPLSGAGLMAVAVAFLSNALVLQKLKTSALEKIAATVYLTYAVITLLNFVRLEVASEWIGIGWLPILLVLLAAGYLLRSRVLGIHAICVGILIVLWSLVKGLDTEDQRVLRMLVITGGFFVCSLLCRMFEGHLDTEKNGARSYSEEFYFGMAVVIMTALLSVETRSGYLTAAWAVEGVLVFFSAIVLDRRAYRLFGLTLLLICTCKILFVDVWTLATLPRIVTFIVLGVSLVLISFLYTKYKDAWRKLVLGKA